MRTWTKIAALFFAAPSLFSLVQAQTTSKCNPRFEKNCPDDPALSGKYEHTFGGEAPRFTTTQSPDMIEYKSDGAHFIVEKSGDAPTIQSDFYIMYGKLNAVIKAAPGHGIVSSLILLSDALDEIDWEWIGSDTGRAQSNYFGKGDTTSYDRAAFHDVAHQEFHDYGIEWTPETVTWSIDGAVVRTLTPDQVKGDFYPQTPMQVKIGPWSGGDKSNNDGTIEWSQGPTDYTQGPFHMIVKSINVQDYSTGQFYHYSDQSGSASSIISKGGQVMVGPGVGGGNNDGGSSTNTPTTFRTPSNTGRTTSSTTTSTKTSSTPGGHSEDGNADTTSETTPTPTGTTTGSSSGFTTSTRTTAGESGKASSPATREATSTASRTSTNTPAPTHGSAAGKINIPILGLAAAVAGGLVGAGLVL